jgi:hypothetical protein
VPLGRFGTKGVFIRALEVGPRDVSEIAVGSPRMENVARMKLLFLSSYAHLVLSGNRERVSGGAELQVALLAGELARRGLNVVVAGGDVGQPDREVHQGVMTRNGGRFQTGGLLDAVRALPKIWRILSEEKPSHVFVLGWTTWLWILMLLRPWFGFRLGFICGLDTEVNGEFRRENPVRGWFFEKGVAGSDFRFAMTEDQARHFAAAGQSSSLYRNLILPRTFAPEGEKSVDLLWVARCQPIKRPMLFLDLVSRFPELQCEMICPREDEVLWNEVAKRAAMLPNLVFREKVPYHEIQGHYDRARIFVNTSTFEGWPNSFIQSGLGRTALASLDVNPDGLFQRYGLGCFGEGDFERLVLGIRELVFDPGALTRAGDECARFVEELHDNTRNVDLFLNALPTLPSR